MESGAACYLFRRGTRWKVTAIGAFLTPKSRRLPATPMGAGYLQQDAFISIKILMG
jgi:hypothetical protein